MKGKLGIDWVEVSVACTLSLPVSVCFGVLMVVSFTSQNLVISLVSFIPAIILWKYFVSWLFKENRLFLNRYRIRTGGNVNG